MGYARARKPIVCEAALERIEVREARYDDGHIGVIRHAWRSRIQEEFGYKGTNYAERNAKLSKPALKIRDDGNEPWFNPWHR